MNFNFSELSSAIVVTVDLVLAGNERNTESIAALRISAIPELSGGGGFRVVGIEAASSGGASAVRTTRIAAHGRNQGLWLLIANAAYALSHAKFDQV
jgi:hypothetical protein